MPFNWRSFLPYGIGHFIPNPATPAPSAPAPPSGGYAPTGWQQYSGSPAPTSLYTGNWGQTGSASDPNAGMSAFGSSTTPNTSVSSPTYSTAVAAPAAPAYPSGNPLAASGNTASLNPFAGVGNAIAGAFQPGGAFGDAPGGGRPNTGGYGGAFGGVPSWGAAGVAQAAAGQNPGATGTAAQDLGAPGIVARLNGNAR